MQHNMALAIMVKQFRLLETAISEKGIAFMSFPAERKNHIHNPEDIF